MWLVAEEMEEVVVEVWVDPVAVVQGRIGLTLMSLVAEEMEEVVVEVWVDTVAVVNREGRRLALMSLVAEDDKESVVEEDLLVLAVAVELGITAILVDGTSDAVKLVILPGIGLVVTCAIAFTSSSVL